MTWAVRSKRENNATLSPAVENIAKAGTQEHWKYIYSSFRGNKYMTFATTKGGERIGFINGISGLIMHENRYGLFACMGDYPCPIAYPAFDQIVDVFSGSIV